VGEIADVVGDPGLDEDLLEGAARADDHDDHGHRLDGLAA
jgi:hypothetical protein